MAYKHSPYAMKKLTFMMLLAAFFTLCVTLPCVLHHVQRMTMTVLLILWNSSMANGKPLRLRLMVNGMMLPNTLIQGLEWTLPSMRVADSMALAI